MQTKDFYTDPDYLDRDLNKDVSYQKFFEAFGYTDRENIYLRTFDDRDKNGRGLNKTVPFSHFDEILPNLHNENDGFKGVFFIVNGGGHDDKAVKKAGKARACFIDGDELTLEEQLQSLRKFPLEPSIIVRTSKSLHAYWITPDGEIKYFRELQQRLIQYFHSDPVIKNESRVMRLYGFNHCKAEPVEVKLIKFDPGITYTQRQLHEVLPLLEKQGKPASTSAKRTGGDMIAIIRNAVTSIQVKKETREEIETNLSGKASEQRIMSAAPILLIAYTSITSPGFLDVCYHNTLGIAIMTFSLLIYAAAFLWGRKIMQIEM